MRDTGGSNDHEIMLNGIEATNNTKFCFQCNKLKFQFADNPGLFNRKPITENRKRYKAIGPAAALRFLTLLHREPTDYVKISRRLYKGQTVDEIFARAGQHWED